MATSSSTSEVDYTCTVCCDIFRDPVVLLCGHSFCKDCLQEWWRQSELKTCPLCKEMFQMRKPPRNLALKNVSDAMRLERSKRVSEGEVCSLHGEKLKLYCQDDQQPICVICRDAKQHKKHNCVLINEAAEDHKTQLKTTLMRLKSKLGIMNSVKLNNEKMASHIQLQAQQMETGIKDEFQKFYQFLRAEEAARIKVVKKEAKKKSQTMKINIVNLTTEISTLSEKIKVVENELKAKDLTIVLNFKSTMERTLCNLAEPKSPFGALMDEAKHLGNLLFKVWSKMKEIFEYFPVILDPNTAGTTGRISENLSRCTMSESNMNLPHNPERYSGVLGAEGIISGRHHWNVEVGGYWAVGVTEIPITYRGEFGIFKCVCTELLRDFTHENAISEDTHSPSKIRVQLDYNQGQLSFYDLDRKVVIHTMTCKFTKPVFPFFRENVKILPAEFSIVAKAKLHR